MSGPRAVVLGHADFAAGLVSAVEQITGLGATLLPLSNAGLGAEEIVQRLREAVERTGIAVVFTDLAGGSTTLAARRLARDVPLTIVTGTSLPALLDFVMSAEGSTAAAADAAVARGRVCLAVAGKP